MIKSLRMWMACLSVGLAAILLSRPARAEQPGPEKTTQQKTQQQQDTVKEKELELKDLIREKSPFGPSARRPAFSFDGRYAAWLYHPYDERRHGYDLYLFDVDSEQIRRVTMPSVMAPFQDSARKVVEDRKKKAQAALKETTRKIEAITKEIQAIDAKARAAKDRAETDKERTEAGKGKTQKSKDKTESDKDKTEEAKQEAEHKGTSEKQKVGHEDKSKTDRKGDKKDQKEQKTDKGKREDEENDNKAPQDDTKDKTKGAGKTEDTGKTKNAGKAKDAGKTKDARTDEQAADQKTDDETQAKADAEKRRGLERQLKELKAKRQRMERGDWVTDKDADDSKAPRYSGIESFAWSPTAQELLFVSEGDVYRYRVEQGNEPDDRNGSIRRLTRTRARESRVTWWPDGSGYCFHRDSALMHVAFGQDIERQLDPRFPNGDAMMTYEISPDGRKIAFITVKQTKPAQASKVEIASYRDRLMKAREVSRQVSDDPLGEYELRVYIYELSRALDEEDTLTEVFVGKKNLPDDDVRALAWSPNAQRLAFLVFDQDDGMVTIYQSRMDGPDKRPPPPSKKPDKADTQKQKQGTDKDSQKEQGAEKRKDEQTKKDTKKDGQTKKDSETQDSGQPEKPESADERTKRYKAQPIFKFYHHGGPNTPRLMTLYYLADNQRLVYLSEQTGFRHLHLLDPLYESMRPLTHGPFEVYPLDISKDRQWIFAQATKEDSACLDVYKISTRNGRMIRLSTERGVHTDAAVSPDGTKLLCNRVSYEKLRELIYVDTTDKEAQPRELTQSHPDEARRFARAKPEFFTYQNRHGHRIRGMGFKPDDWSPKDRRPCLIYFYGGPLGTRKQVVEGSYSDYVYGFPYYMAKKHGYVAVSIDPRGNSGYAGVFEKANYGQVGKPQVEDIVDCVDYLVRHWGVDPKRVAIHGWSFGGFQTQMCMYTAPDVFAAGIAGAGPTEWENYNAWYTHHTIGNSETGKATLKTFSLLPLAKNLKGNLLLVHGMEDDNVLYQDTIKVYRELLKAGKETLVELFLDPTGGHGLGGDVNRLARYRKYEQFLLRTIGRYEPPAPEAAKQPPKAADTEDAKTAQKAKAKQGQTTDKTKKPVPQS